MATTTRKEIMPRKLRSASLIMIHPDATDAFLHSYGEANGVERIDIFPLDGSNQGQIGITYRNEAFAISSETDMQQRLAWIDQMRKQSSSWAIAIIYTHHREHRAANQKAEVAHVA
ncbi:MAG: hypothetical protein ACK51V_01980 [bacterium]